MLKRIVIFNSFILISFCSVAQIPRATVQKSVASNQLKWENPVTEVLPDGRTVSYICFANATYDPKTRPFPTYYETEALAGNPSGISVNIVNDVYEPLSSAESALISQNNNIISNKINITAFVGYSRKKAYAQIKFIPIRKNPVTGAYEKLVSFNLDIQKINTLRSHTPSSMSFVANSVLATGTWYKIGVTQDGIYKLSYQFLKNIGMDVQNIDPKNIRVYGNGGGMLPLANSTFRHDDLVEDPIYVSEQSQANLDSAGYVLFYGQGPVIWSYDSTDNRFHHQNNYYSDTTYYFITADLGIGKRISTLSSSVLPATNTVNSFDDYAYHDVDATNLILSGNRWYGEEFNILNSYNFTFNFPNIDASSKVYVNADIAARGCSINPSFSVSSQSGSTTLIMQPVDCLCFDCIYATETDSSYTFTPSGSSINVTVTNNTPSAVGWLNYIELNARRQLTMVGDQMQFQDTKSVGASNISQFNVSSFLPVQVWDITDPTNAQAVSTTLSGTDYQFTLPTSTLRKFISFTGSSYLTPLNFGMVPNQNLHAYAKADLIIVTNPKFLNQANNLANFHSTQDNLNVVVATTTQIYNEFSGGEQDPVGIRDFVKMFYDRASVPSDAPKYLLLMGRGSYDNKHRISNNTDYVPTYESDNSLDPTNSYVSDDFYGLLDDNEGDWTSNYMLDIGIGRMPVQTTTDAQNIVNKIIRYETNSGPLASDANTCNCGTQAQNYTLADWRNQICFVAHDQDITFESQSDQLSNQVETNYKNYNVNKIYFDAYQEETTPGGERYPDAENAINQQVQKGAFIVNYLGHGGVYGWGVERVLSIADIESWTNMNTLPLFVTATCEFSRFDDPSQVAAGEDVLLNANGGGIGLLTTTRVVYSGPNFTLNQNFFSVLLTPVNNQFPRMGDLMMETKNLSGTLVNNRNFTFLGDPAVMPAFPHYNITTTSIAAIPADGDTIKALTPVQITGFVSDSSGNKLSNFNGIIYPTIYDKPKSITTLSNGGTAINPPFTFNLQNSVLYKGKVSVTNGNFSFKFVVPKDIAYNYGSGRVSYYAENGTQDAAGQSKNFIVGGSNPHPNNDVTGPTIKLYLNDDKFVYGGMTNANPQLYATVFDSSGINTVGNGIGHDITAILDNNTVNEISLNDYYQSDLNSYQSGTITYPFSGLSPGTHTLTLRVWDVYNNSSEATTEFVVSQSSQFQLDHVLNYPNPFTTNTNFYFEQNFGCGQYAVQIQVFTVSGKLVKTINTNVQTQGFRSDPIEWNGRDDYGNKIGNGVYIYHLIVKASDGSVADKYDKLVIL